MKKHFKIWSLVLLGLLVLSTQTAAHHGYPQYNMGGPGIVLNGTIGSYRMSNPHSYMTIIVLNDNGEEELWAVETTDTLRGMRQKGFSADTLKQGDAVKMMVSPALNGDRTAVFRSVELSDGTIMPAPTPR
jgi:hypothetical protein